MMYIIGIIAFAIWIKVIKACTPAGLNMPIVQDALKTAILAEARMRERMDKWNNSNMR